MDINLTILTGAGISAESGIPTFRDAKTGLWENHKVEDVATPEAYIKDPALVHRFYNERRMSLLEVEPNAAHYALARLEKYWTENDIGGFLLITQNIDDLHERAGSKNIAHIHGELMKIRCTKCNEVSKFSGYSQPEHICPACFLCDGLRPHVVWFGEMPLYLDAVEKVLDMTDHYIAVGTSGSVMPASLFAECVSRNGRYSGQFGEIVEITKEITNTPGFTIRVEGNATEAVPNYVEILIDTIAQKEDTDDIVG
jgi:NAD-dependent deacetylase